MRVNVIQVVPQIGPKKKNSNPQTFTAQDLVLKMGKLEQKIAILTAKKNSSKGKVSKRLENRINRIKKGCMPFGISRYKVV